MITFLNCSYKVKDTNTEYFLNMLEKEMCLQSYELCKYVNLRDVLKNVSQGTLDVFANTLKESGALVIGAPLYVDGLPAQAVKLLELLYDEYKGEFLGLPVYVVSNLGFYEADQIQHLMAIVENWCMKMGMHYGGGVAVGAGPMVRALDQIPLRNLVLGNVNKGFRRLAEAILNRKKTKNYYTKISIPRAVYLKAAHMNFDNTVKENGLDIKTVRRGGMYEQ